MVCPPPAEDDYASFSASVLHYTLLILILIALIFLLFATSTAELIFMPVALVVLGGSYYLLHRGYFRIASLIFLVGVWLIITIASFSINGIRNSSVSLYAVVIIFSAILLSARAAITSAVTSILSAIIMVLGESAGVLPLRMTPFYTADRLFQMIALFGAAGVLLSSSARVIRMSLVRIREHERLLVERNRELEMQIAERHRSEAGLRISEERYRLLFENTPAMAGVFSGDGTIILLNPLAAQFLGGTPESLQGRNLRDIYPAEVTGSLVEWQTRVLQAGSAQLIEGKTTLPTGGEIYYLQHIMPLPSSSETPSQVLVLTTDITEKQIAEQRERELTRANERNAFLTEFFGTVSHDLKTPLAVMNTSLYLITRAQTAAQREMRLQQISNQVEQMDSYLQDMLTISRLEHLPAFKSESLDLNPLVEEVSFSLHSRLEGKRLTYQVMTQPNLPAVEGDAGQLRRLLTNLIENAINYTPEDGVISVKTEIVDRQIVLEIYDSGMGIEPEALPHIFDRFFRAASAIASESKGTGLGLAIVKKIVDMHGASIDVRSELGEGTTFSVKFPVKVRG